MRRVKKERISWRVRLIIAGTLVFIMGIVGFCISPYGRATGQFVQAAYHTMIGKAHLVLEQVVIEGHARTQSSSINNALKLKQGTPIFNIDLAEAREKLLRLPWIKKAVIERHLPSTIFIRIEEKTPIAVWQNNKKYFPLEINGNPIPDDTIAFADLILVVGQDAPQHTPALIKTLEKYPSIYTKVRVAVRQGKRRWDLILNDVNDGIEVNLPESDIDYALRQLEKVMSENKLMKRDLKRINLLHRDRLIVRPRKGVKK